MENELKKTGEEFLGREITDDEEYNLEEVVYDANISISDFETKEGWLKIMLSLEKSFTDLTKRLDYKVKVTRELVKLLKLAGKQGKAFYNLYDCIEGVRISLDPVELNELYEAILKIEEK